MDFSKIVKYGLKAAAGYAIYTIASPHIQKLTSVGKRSISSLKKNHRKNKNT